MPNAEWWRYLLYIRTVQNIELLIKERKKQQECPSTTIAYPCRFIVSMENHSRPTSLPPSLAVQFSRSSWQKSLVNNAKTFPYISNQPRTKCNIIRSLELWNNISYCVFVNNSQSQSHTVANIVQMTGSIELFCWIEGSEAKFEFYIT